MKLIKAEITGFGHYRQQQIDFLTGNQLFYGKNEAGKSTMYQFIQAMLFGFPKKSLRKRDYTPLDQAAYGGKLWLSIEPYGEIRIERFRQVNKGKAKVWIGEEERDEIFLNQLLTPLNQEIFQEVFTFQQEQLSEINRLQEKELHAALVSLGISGSNQLMMKIQAYQKQNQQIFKPRGQRLPLNQRLKEWQQLREMIRQKEAQEMEVQSAYQQVAMLTAQQKRGQEKIQQLQLEQQELNQQKINWPLYEEWQKLRSLKESRITEEEQLQLGNFYIEYQQLSEEIRKKEAELSQLEQGQETDRYFFYLDQEAKIQALLREEVTIARLADQNQRLTTQEQEIQQELTRLTQTWGWQTNQPPQRLEESIYQALDRLEELEEEKKQHRLRIQWFSEKIDLLEEEITKLEEKYPSMLKQSSQVNYGWIVGGVGLLVSVVSLFLPIPLKIILLMLGLIMGAFGVGLSLSQRRDTRTNVRALWQEKLGQLDQLQAELVTEEEQLRTAQQTQEQLIARLQPSFGKNTDYLTWRKMLHEYQLAATAFHEKSEQIQSLHQQCTEVAEKQSAIAKQFIFLEDWLPLANKTLTEKLAITSQFATEMQTIKMTRLQQPSTLLAQQLKRSKENRTVLFEKQAPLLGNFGLSHPTEIPMWMKQWEERQKQEARKMELTQLLAPIFPEKINWQMLSQKLASNEQQQVAVNQQMSQLLEEKQRSQLQIEQLQVDGVLDELYQEESRLLSEIKELALTWSSNQVLSTWLSDLATELSEQQLPQLLRRASYYFELLTDGRYYRVILTDGILHVASKDSLLDIYTLSTGTKDQLIMAMRFAYLSLQEDSVSPVIIDDGWLHYDSERKERLAQLFAEFGKKHQVICLSSDKEMVSYYQRLHQSVVEMN